MKTIMSKIINDVNADIAKIINKNKSELNTQYIHSINSAQTDYIVLLAKWGLAKRITL